MADATDPAIVQLAARLLQHRAGRQTLLIGITGSVAVGKTTLAKTLAKCLSAGDQNSHVEIVSTDGFLRPNAELDASGLTMRKGFPESYDQKLFQQVLGDLRHGQAVVPSYSHRIYDIDPAAARRVEGADIVIVEGLGFPVPAVPIVDALIYIDAGEDDIESWFVTRFMRFWREAENDSTSFYARFRELTAQGAQDFARKVWLDINLPNLQDHIVRARDTADYVLGKSRDHSVVLNRVP